MERAAAQRHKMPTLEDVARVAGVSRATVSRVIRNDPTSSEQARKLVEEAVAQTGYVPNRLARSLVTRTTDAVAVVVAEPDETVFNDPFFATTIAGIAAGLEGAHKHLSLLMGGSNSQRNLDTYLRGGYADAVILVSHHGDDRLLNQIIEADIPFALIGRPINHHLDTCYVDTDNELGAYLATSHLISRGCRRIALINGPQNMGVSIDRRKGYELALAENNLTSAADLTGNFTPEGAQAAILAALESGIRFDGLFIASDLMAAAVIPVLKRSGFDVPRQVKIVGFDDSRIAVVTTPQLTTITNPSRALGEGAAAMVLKQLRGGTVAEPMIIRPQLNQRESA